MSSKGLWKRVPWDELFVSHLIAAANLPIGVGSVCCAWRCWLPLATVEVLACVTRSRLLLLLRFPPLSHLVPLKPFFKVRLLCLNSSDLSEGKLFYLLNFLKGKGQIFVMKNPECFFGLGIILQEVYFQLAQAPSLE